jgi:hypothetical protein
VIKFYQANKKTVTILLLLLGCVYFALLIGLKENVVFYKNIGADATAILIFSVGFLFGVVFLFLVYGQWFGSAKSGGISTVFKKVFFGMLLTTFVLLTYLILRFFILKM